MDGKREIHVPVFVEISRSNSSVIEPARPAHVLPDLPVSFAVAEENHWDPRAATALGRGNDVRTSVAVHVRDGRPVTPRADCGQTLGGFLEANRLRALRRIELEKLRADTLQILDVLVGEAGVRLSTLPQVLFERRLRLHHFFPDPHPLIVLLVQLPIRVHEAEWTDRIPVLAARVDRPESIIFPDLVLLSKPPEDLVRIGIAARILGRPQ